jgi:hypothetical protein
MLHDIAPTNDVIKNVITLLEELERMLFQRNEMMRKEKVIRNKEVMSRY